MGAATVTGSGSSGARQAVAGGKGVLRLWGIVGQATDPGIAERLHRLDHSGRVESVRLDRDDVSRHRLRVLTDHGSECAISLPRAARLSDGSVLLLESDRAIVVRLKERQWLTLAPSDKAAALELGYFAGNMHWPVRFEGERLCLALQGPVEDYLDRLAPLLREGRVRPVGHE